MLHLINYVFSDPTETGRCLARVGDEDSVLFIANGVFSLLKASRTAPELESQMGRIRFHALQPDLAARGISSHDLLRNVQIIDYSGFVALAAEHGPVQSWFQ